MQLLKNPGLLGGTAGVSQTRVHACELKAKSGAAGILDNSRFQEIACLGEALQERETLNYADFGGEVLWI